MLPNLENIVPIKFDEKDKIRFKNATHCIICQEKLEHEHDHASGKFRGAAHQICNLNYSIEKKQARLTIVFHNLKNYDAHLIFQHIKSWHGKINIVANTVEKYITFTIGRFKFIDSFQFLNFSLQKLATTCTKFYYLTKQFPK